MTHHASRALHFVPRCLFAALLGAGLLAGPLERLAAGAPPAELPAAPRAERESEREAALRVRPSPQQVAWQELEFIAFAHFGINTFTDREWGDGKEDPKRFAPTDFDARQWTRVLKAAGAKLLILTAKHHDGFCLWPSRYTEHSVKNSPWRGGKGDVVREVSDACRAEGLKFGVYLSPWDRNSPYYGDSPRYNDHFVAQLTELLTNYGPVAEVWFDGACAEGPNGKRQEYDWKRYYATIRKLQPDAVIAISGPDVRWVGNESGVARETEWSVQKASATFHDREGWVWWPAECDVSIRPGWFYHASQDDKVKSLSHLLDIWHQSVGRNSVLLLNVPPDRRGRIHENDARRLLELRRALDATYRVNLARGARVIEASASRGDGVAAHGPDRALDGDRATWWQPAEEPPVRIELDLGREATFDRSMLEEPIALGQRVERYRIEALVEGEWRPVARGTTIGHRKLDRFEPVRARRARVVIESSRGRPLLREFGLFASPAAAGSR